jgi:predicted CoA-substrate-specific enzyme activase
MGLDIGSRSAKCVILDDGKLLTYGQVETGPDSCKAAHVAVDAAIRRREEFWGQNRMPLPDVATDRLRIEDMDCIVATGYSRLVVPFAHATVTEISCHGRGAHWLVPGVSTVLDMGGQDCKAIRVNERGEITNFVMNDKCAGGTGRFLEIIADALKVSLFDIGELSLSSRKSIAFSHVCALYAKSEAVASLRQGEEKADILAGLHDVISTRVLALLRGVGIADKFVITGGIAKNIGVVAKIGEKLGGIEIVIPVEPMIAGALGAALFALDRARKEDNLRRNVGVRVGAPTHSAAPG